MSRDLVNSLTVKSFDAMRNIVNNWVNCENFANTASSKQTAIALQKLLSGLADKDMKQAAEGIELLDVVVREQFNLKK